MINNTLDKKIKKQLAHVMANYGDNPEELFYKLECLVIEWYTQGITKGVNLAKKEIEKVN